MDYSALASLFQPETVTSIVSVLGTVSSTLYLVAIAATKLPKATPTSATWYKVIRALVDFAAANFGNAKNEKT